MKISDETQRDPKERGHMGVDRHERLIFTMSPTGQAVPTSVPETVRSLCERLSAKGKGSYISTTLKDCTVKVEVLSLDMLWKWEVKKNREVVDYGIAKVTDRGTERGIALEKGEETS